MDGRTRIDIDGDAKEKLDGIADDVRGTKKEIASEALVRGVKSMKEEYELDGGEDNIL